LKKEGAALKRLKTNPELSESDQTGLPEYFGRQGKARNRTFPKENAESPVTGKR
jgi:hypothetical protein